MAKLSEKSEQVTLRNGSSQGLVAVSQEIDSISAWVGAYFRFEVTTMKSTQKVQKRDLTYFLTYMIHEVGKDTLAEWTPRLSKAFVSWLQNAVNHNGKRRWNDRTVNRILAHLKTFARWVHKLRPFPLGNPMAKVKPHATASYLSIDRAITRTERRRLLDAADVLVEIGGRSKDRHRYKGLIKRPQRKDYRPFRNRAIVYTLIETGMRRAAIVSINLDDIDGTTQAIRTIEKGGIQHIYQISSEGLEAIQDYLAKERDLDANKHEGSPALFLPAIGKMNQHGRLSVNAINEVWNAVCRAANVTGRTPHSARHGVGRYLMEKTGNVEAVQRQLGHRNAAYSLQYSRITREELSNALDERA